MGPGTGAPTSCRGPDDRHEQPGPRPTPARAVRRHPCRPSRPGALQPGLGARPSDPPVGVHLMSSNLAPMIEHFLLRELRSLRLELEAYHDESLIWAQPAGLPNSTGTLALHLAGNLRHYVGAVLGGNGYIRDRDLEFSARGLSRM